MPSDPATCDDPADPPIYHVAFPMATEGPFTLGELRAMVAAGRANADDRVMRETTRQTWKIIELVPDARELGDKAQRVRRSSTSGAHRVQRGGNEVRRLRTPVPFVPEAPAAAPSADPAPPPRARSLRLQILATVLAILAAGLVVLCVLSFNPSPPQPPVGVWRVDSLGRAGGPWILSLDETRITVTGPDGRAAGSAMERQVLDDFLVVITLREPHPVLGRTISLAGSAVLEVSAGKLSGTGRLQP